MKTDAKIFAMIYDLSNSSLAALVRQQYEAGKLSASDIVAMWDDDAETRDYDDNGNLKAGVDH